MTENRLAQLLREASADAPPTRSIDLGRARAEGGRRLRRRRAVLATVGSAVAVLAIAGGTAIALAPRPGVTPPGSTATPSPSAPAQRDISSRVVDPTPLTAADVFPGQSIVVDADTTYQRLGEAEVDSDCRVAAIGATSGYLADTGCSQVVRATFSAPRGNYLVTAGIVNLVDEAAADAAVTAIQSQLAGGQGRLSGYVAPDKVGSTEIMQGAPARVFLLAKGHFLLYLLVAHADGDDVTDTDDLGLIRDDLLTTYLRDTVLANWAKPTMTGGGLRMALSAGWLPDGVVRLRQWSTDGSLRYDNPTTGQSVTIMLLAPGEVPGSDRPSAPGPTIGGSPSTWYADDGHGASELTWQWTANAWATLDLVGDLGGAPLDVAAHIATSLDTNANLPVRLPFSVPELPAPLTLAEASFTRDDDGTFDAEIQFNESGVELSSPAATITVGNDGSGAGSPTTTIGGRPAIVADDDHGRHRVVLFGANEINIEIVAMPVAAFVDSAAAIAFAQVVTVVADPLDQSTWVAPLR